MAAAHPWIKTWPENIDFSKQSVPVPGTQRSGQTSKNRRVSRLTYPHPDAVFRLKVPTEAVCRFLFARVQTLNPVGSRIPLLHLGRRRTL